jgi:hypothetical protein
MDIQISYVFEKNSNFYLECITFIKSEKNRGASQQELKTWFNSQTEGLSYL